jgi:hypothetical protein
MEAPVFHENPELDIVFTDEEIELPASGVKITEISEVGNAFPNTTDPDDELDIVTVSDLIIKLFGNVTDCCPE